ncbi:hypothetical protein DPEC_G00226770 [Dallia pectoralis]|uniref:Uncharacterized protein n=1 Tax=Dallia pectoralis TaxID=75939 RepID=A0ACC2G0T0_DALPE|nr:hypothetical protein DPEC_G00226770 [Dallia pectoralis]
MRPHLSRQKEEQLDDKQFEDRFLESQTLPSLSTDFLHWLRMNDWERLSAASRDLHTFWYHLDIKRRELKAECGPRTAQKLGNRRKSGHMLFESIQGIQTDLRDLMKKVKFQLKSLSSPTSPSMVNHSDGLRLRSRVNTNSLPAQSRTVSRPSAYQHTSKSLWTRRLEGYVILRDLERYLIKLARDFILLKIKHKGPGSQHKALTRTKVSMTQLHHS